MSALRSFVLFSSVLLSSATRANDLPPAFIDHVYIKLDDQTYKSLPQQTWLKELGLAFCEFDKKVSSWEGHYIQGAQGYLELFSKSKMADHSHIRAQSAIGFYTERPNTIKSFHRALAENKFELFENFFSYSTYVTHGAFSTWVMEPKASFLEGPSIRREDWSAFFRKKAGESSTPKIRRIEKISIELSLPERNLLEKTLKTLNYTHKNQNTFMGTETEIQIYSPSNPRGITDVEFSIESSKESKLENKQVTVGSWNFILDAAKDRLSFRLNDR